jgi:hypothetical protein
MGTGAARDYYALRDDLRAVNAPKIAAMVIRYFGCTEVFVAVVCAVGHLPFVLPITDAVFTAHAAAKILWIKDHVVGSNLGPDHVVKQAVVEEISLKRSHAREILLIPLLQKGAALFIAHFPSAKASVLLGNC